MFSIQLTIFAAILFPVLFLISLSFGGVVSFRFDLARLTIAERLAVDLLLGVLVVAVVYLLFNLLNISGVALQLSLGGTIAIVLWLRRSALKEIFRNEDLRVAFLSQWFFFLTVSFTASLVSGIGYISPVSLMNFTGLPIDLLIPFNSARFFLENIPFAAQDVVPGWAVTDRGPLSSLVIAFYISLFGIKDLGGWLDPNPLAYSAGYLVLVFLNTLAIPALYLLLSGFSRRAAALSLLFLLTSYFFFVNILFPWPKFLAAALFLYAFLLLHKKHHFFAGVFLAAAMLAHESVVFAIVVLVALCILRTLLDLWQKKERLSNLFSQLGVSLLGFMIIYAPWIITKNIAGPETQGRLLYFHLFCDKDLGALQQPFLATLLLYLKDHSIADLISVRFDNLLYPFNIFHPLGAVKDLLNNPWHLLRTVSPLSFYQYIFAVGALLFLKACLSLRHLSLEAKSFFAPLFLVSIGAVLPAAIVFGCPLSSWAHHWAYPAILATVALGAFPPRKYPLLDRLLLSFALLNNAIFLYFQLYEKRLFHVASFNAASLQIVLFLGCLTFLVYHYRTYSKEIND